MLRIDPTVPDDLIAHAREGAPEEVCGVLAGTRSDSRAGADDSVGDGRGATDRVRGAHRVENVAENPRTRYEMAPAVLLETVESVEGDGRDVVGFYHSHPRGPAAPSATDRERATWDGYCYVIVSLTGAEDSAREHTATVRAWRWDAAADEFREETVVAE